MFSISSFKYLTEYVVELQGSCLSPGHLGHIWNLLNY